MRHARALRHSAGAGALLLAGAVALGTTTVAASASQAGGRPGSRVITVATATPGTGGTSAGATAGAATTVPDGAISSITRQQLETALADRQRALAALTSSVNGSALLAATVRSTLLSQLAAETTGINGLATQAPTAPTTQLASLATTMVHQYRVYLVMAPKVGISERTAAQSAAETKVTAAEPVIEQRIQNTIARGHTVGTAQTTFEQMVSTVTQASGDTQAVDVASVLGVTPAGYPGDGGPLSAARSSLQAARALRPQIRADLLEIRSDLRDGRLG